MKVSVVIPAYNAAETIGATLESLLAQTHPGWEAIVVDDGSRDTTAARAKSFAKRDPRIRVVRQANAGEAGARNSGIAAARYDWILFLDADDWIAPEHLERMTGKLAEDPGFDAVHCGYARVAGDGSLIVEQYVPPSGDMFTTWARRSAFPVHACVVRKALVDGVGGFDVSLRKSADWDLWQRIARTGARFGAMREVLAYYRMTPGAASLDAQEMLEDGLRVLRQGHAPDPRVADPHPDHVQGASPEDLPSQEFYLLSWCAGLMLGSGKDPSSLLKQLEGERFPELYPPAVAQCLFDAAALPSCSPPSAWERLWPALRPSIDTFLAALEQHAGAPGLAERARSALALMTLAHSPSWAPALQELDAAKAALEAEKSGLEQQRDWLQQVKDRWELLAEERAQSLEELNRTLADASASGQRWEGIATERQAAIQQLTARSEILEQGNEALRRNTEALEQRTRSLQGSNEALQGSNQALQGDIEALQASHESLQRNNEALRRSGEALERERNAVYNSPERAMGDLLLNRLKLARPLGAFHSFATAMGQRLVVARLAVERWFSRRGQPRIVATACWNFPIYSQTFVYQELSQLKRLGMKLRFMYSKLDPHDQLPRSFDHLWRDRRRLFLNMKGHRRDFAHYQRRMPDRIAALVTRLSQASGLHEHDVLAHGNFLEAFSFMRMLEAYRPHYLHSYFFYDRSLMALIAGHLLEIPRGMSCYADHTLKDYDFKVVGLHLELCDVVIATSERIKRELLEIAPQADPARILVKPNGIDTERFASQERSEPVNGSPYRLVTVSRIEPKKGLIELVEAVGLLRDRGRQVHAHLVGAPDEWSAASREYKRQLDERISELNLWGTVHLEGRQGVEGVQRLLGSAHVFVAPFVETDSGDRDGIPTALLEGMATGLPSVATDAGSIAEVIQDGREGVLVPQRNPAALADAIEALLLDPERRARLGRDAAARVREDFDVRTCETVFHERVTGLVRGGSA